VQEDAAGLPGSIAIELRDADNHPVTHEVINLGILINSIAKGDSRKHLQATTDDRGQTRFTDLEMASNIAYRVSCGYQGGLFAASPFQIPQGKAIHVVLHVYPVTRDINEALVVSEAAVAAEVRDDRLQIEEALTFYNLGKTAWQPEDVRLSLPSSFTAFSAQASMSDQGVDESAGSAKLRGTFPPGQHTVEFRWQLPWSGDKDVDFDVGLPPRVAIARVLMPATSEIQLTAGGFPPAEVRKDSRGQSFLVTERRMRPDDARMGYLAIGIHNLPTPGPGRLLAVALTTIAAGLGVYFAIRGRRASLDAGGPLGGPGGAANVRGVRQSVLEDLLALEKARAVGDVGPQTYERTRRQLIDALATTLAQPA
jgi:hypothetical protein